MACSCFMLVAHFIVEMVDFENKMREEEADADAELEQQAPWDRFGVGFFSIFAVAFVLIAIFSGSVINSMINNNGSKVVPAPTSSVEHDQPPMVQ
ncbi:hypothetical protein K1719_004570 [Acacia pycnantha]|nr:hypothetical protein K1719_004570 [Acacia pycnantha]